MTLNVRLQRIGICHFVAAGLLLVTSASVRAQTVVSTIQVGKDPVAVAVNSVTHQVFVANFGPNYPASGPCVAEWGIVSVIDGATQSTHAVGLGLLQSPVAVAVNSATDKAYVVSGAITNFSWGVCNKLASVTAIDGTNLSASQLASLGWVRFPRAVAVNGVTGNVYVVETDTGLRRVAVIDGNTGALTTVQVGSDPTALAVNPTTDKIYVANLYSNNISVIDGATNSVTIIADSNAVGPTAVALDPTTNKVYVANGSSNNITVIDGVTNTTTTLSDPNASAPHALAVNSTTNKIYVTNSGSNNVTVIDGDTNAITTVAVGVSPVAVALSEQTNRVYVANAGSSQSGNPGSITVIDGGTNTAITLTDPKALNPSAIAVDPAMDQMYVANSGSNNVTVIDGGGPRFTLSVTTSGGGSGTVTSNPAGINCGSTCLAMFTIGTPVTLTATSNTSSNFTGWSGACSGTASCSVTMSAAESVTATFTLQDFSLAATSTSLTVPRGGQGTDAITIAPQNGSFASAILLSCSVVGPSPMPTCGLSPASVTPGANSASSTLTITAPAASAMLQPTTRGQFKFYAAWLPLPGIALIGIGLISRKQRDRKRNLWLLTGSLLAVFALVAGCGGSNGPPPPQNYTVTVTGTSGAIQHMTQVTLTVQ